MTKQGKDAAHEDIASEVPASIPRGCGTTPRPAGREAEAARLQARAAEQRKAGAGQEVYTVRVHHEPDEQLWAEVLELPGVFATGTDMEDLRQALQEAISLYLSEDDGEQKHVELEDDPAPVSEHRMLARTA